LVTNNKQNDHIDILQSSFALSPYYAFLNIAFHAMCSIAV